MKKSDLLKETIDHIDIKSFDSTPIIDSMRKMSFTSRDTASAADILVKMIENNECTNILTSAWFSGGAAELTRHREQGNE